MGWLVRVIFYNQAKIKFDEIFLPGVPKTMHVEIIFSVEYFITAMYNVYIFV